MEKDITIGLILILAGMLFAWWSYKEPTPNSKTDMMNADFKGYLWGLFSLIVGVTIIVRCISAGKGLL